VTVLVDPALWPRHGRLWGHLVSDTSLEELHALARTAGIPDRGFDRDHYDVPAELHARLVELGAVPVTAHELVRRLRASGLRVTGRERRTETDSAAEEGAARTDSAAEEGAARTDSAAEEDAARIDSSAAPPHLEESTEPNG